jgi:hypothetical protein
MTTAFTPEALQKIAYSVYSGVYNRRQPYVVDRKAMPWWSFLMRNEDTAPLAGADGVVVKYKTDCGLTLQGWERKDILAFGESNIELDLKFPWANVHQGNQLVHDDIEAMGYVVLPNQPRGKNFAKPDSESEAYRLVNYVEETIEAMMDKFDVESDKLLLRDNSTDPKLPQGLDGYLPNGAATGYVSAGSIGGRARLSFPEQLQHYCFVGATYATTGTLRQALITARREANLRARGRVGGGVDYIMAGAGAIDRYVQFAQNNNIQFWTQLSDGKRQVDIGIPDTGLHFEGIPIVHNPTFEILDAADAPSLPWTRRMYLMNAKSWKMAYAPNKKKFFSAPPDEGDLRVTRLSLDSKMNLLPLIVNANAIVNIAS